jgi:hypothetical protein
MSTSVPLKSERFEMLVDPAFLQRLDNWRRKQPDLPSRAEAIRRLVEIGLVASKHRGLRRDVEIALAHRGQS